MIKESKTKSENEKKLVKEKFEALGFNENQFNKTLDYIKEEAPLIIHFKSRDVLEKLLNDKYYRNQFETKTSNGALCETSRINWEDRMFNKIYHDANGFHRVKYGVLNYMKNPRGVPSCSQYGDSYFVLKNETVRFRVTLASSDTSDSDVAIGTCEHYCHVLNKYKNQELDHLAKVANGEISKSAAKDSNYKEIQVHGEVRLDRDIQKIVIAKRFIHDKRIVSLAKSFAKKNGCEHNLT